MKKGPIIIPLDGMDKNKALEMAEKLSGMVWGFKVNDLLDPYGVSIISELKKYGNVFADPKLHDIPNTVANRIKKYVAVKADLITVHASGGIEMMRAAVGASDKIGIMKAAAGIEEYSQILAVTILTSLDEDTTHNIYGSPVKAKVLQLARDAKLANVDGIVCSAKELGMLSKHEELARLTKVTPGIRPDWYQAEAKKEDQKRVMTPAEAIKLGADLLVIGRPITKADDPVEAVERTNEEIEAVKEKGIS